MLTAASLAEAGGEVAAGGAGAATGAAAVASGGAMRGGGRARCAVAGADFSAAARAQRIKSRSAGPDRLRAKRMKSRRRAGFWTGLRATGRPLPL